MGRGDHSRGASRVAGALVVDASALVDYFLAQPLPVPLGDRLRAADELHIPELCDIEFVSVMRRFLREGRVTAPRTEEALVNYAALTLRRHRHLDFLPRVLDLRDNFSAYDAVYVALAERLSAPLLTSDARLANAIRAARGVNVALA